MTGEIQIVMLLLVATKSLMVSSLLWISDNFATIIDVEVLFRTHLRHIIIVF